MNDEASHLASWLQAPHNHAVGRLGEDWAWMHLEKNGYKLVERNWRFGRHEIDLIVEDGDGTLVFVEVKANRNPLSGAPGERVDARKRQSVARVAERYCWKTGQGRRSMRFDVITLEVRGQELEIDHHLNAFLPDARHYFGY